MGGRAAWVSLCVVMATPAAAQTLIGRWTFDSPVESLGKWGGLELGGGAVIEGGRLRLGTGATGGWARAVGYTGPAISTKTLVAWVALHDLSVGTGSAMALDHKTIDQFDSLTYAERKPKRWMNGSTNYARTDDVVTVDEGAVNQTIQLAASYTQGAGGQTTVTLCRNGVQIGQYTKGAFPTWNATDAEVLFGARILQGNTPVGVLRGSIEEGRLYSGALTCAQVGRLVPSSMVEPALVAHWTFDELGAPRERTGNWGPLELGGTARLSGGFLRLGALGWAHARDYIGPTLTEKSLVSWVSLESLASLHGSALSLQNLFGDHFDGIVYGGKVARRWGAGSEGYIRAGNSAPADEMVSGAVIQVGVSYQADGRIRVCRNGRQLESYVPATVGPLSYNPGDAHVSLGAPWVPPPGYPPPALSLVGSIDEVRIYNKALDCAGMAQLTRSPTDFAGPAASQAPVDGLVAHLPGVLASRADPATTLGWAGSVQTSLSETGPGQGGRFLRFNAATAGEVSVILPRPLLPRPVPPDELAAGRGAGATVSFWFRDPGGSPTAAAVFNPLVWMIPGCAGCSGPVLSLVGGAPALRFEGSPDPRFFSSAPRIDDGVWHHVAIAFERADAACTSTSCQVERRSRVRLYVDEDEWGTLLLAGKDLGSIVRFGVSLSDGTTTRRTHGDFDDLRVYERMLLPAEVAQLARQRSDGIRAIFPPVDPTRYPGLGGAPASDGTGLPGGRPAVPVQGGYDLLSRPLSATTPLAAPPHPDLAEDLRGIRRGTVQAWLGTTAWTHLVLSLPTGHGVDIYTESGRAVHIFCYDLQGKVWAGASPPPAPGTPPPWHLLSVAFDTQAPGGLVTVNAQLGGMLPVSVGCGSAGSANAPVRLEAHGAATSGTVFNEPLRVLGVRLFDRLLSADEQQARGGAGPVIWIDPSDPVIPQAAQPFPAAPRSWLASPAALGGAPAGPAVTRLSLVGEYLLTWNGTLPAAPLALQRPGAYWLVLAEVGGTALDAKSQTDPLTDDGFTVSVLATVAPSTADQVVSLVQRSSESGWDVQAYLHCKPSDGGCWPYVRVPSGGPGSPVQTWLAAKTVPMGAPVRLTFTSVIPRAGGTVAPRVAINGEPFTPGDPNRPLVDAAEFVLPKAYRPTHATAPSWQLGHLGWTGPIQPVAVTFADARVLPYALGDVAVFGATCTGLACGEAGRVCLTADPARGAACTGCTDQAYVGAVAPGPTQMECRDLGGGGASCAMGAECRTGVCAAGSVCLSSTAEECAATCGYLNRTCTPGPPGTWQCGVCGTGYRYLDAKAATQATACVWDPTFEDFEPCTADAQCFSGKCLGVLADRFHVVANVSYVTKSWYDEYKVGVIKAGDITCHETYLSTTPANITGNNPFRACAPTTQQACTQRLRTATAVAVTLPDGRPSTYYQCGAVGCNNGFVPRYPVLSPDACRLGWDRADDSTDGGECRVQKFTASCACYPKIDTRFQSFTFSRGAEWRDLATNQASSTDLLKILKQMVLGDISANPDVTTNTAKLLTDLENAGVGKLLLQYVRSTPTERTALEAQFGKFLPFGHCASERCQPNLSTDLRCAYYHGFNTEPYNIPTCVPERKPNTTPCPPPGVAPGTAQPQDFCESRYCDRYKRTCEDGSSELLLPGPMGGNQHNSGAHNTRFGVIKMDNATLEVDEANTADPGDDDWLYDASLSTTYNLCMFGLHVPVIPPSPTPKSLFRVDIDLSRKRPISTVWTTPSPDVCAETELRTYFLEVPLTAPPIGPLLGSCQGMKITNGMVCSPPGCQLPNPENFTLTSILFGLGDPPKLEVCVPIPDKEIFSQPISILPMPPVVLTVSVGLGICLESYIGMADNGLPKLEIKPAFDVHLSSVAELGFEIAPELEISVSAGLVVLLAGVSFPIVYGLDVALDVFQGTEPNGTLAPQAVLNLEFGVTISAIVEFLSGSFFLEVAMTFFEAISLTRTIELFAWTGFQFEFTLYEATLARTRLDFDFAPDFLTSGGGKSSVCNGQCGNWRRPPCVHTGPSSSWSSPLRWRSCGWRSMRRRSPPAMRRRKRFPPGRERVKRRPSPSHRRVRPSPPSRLPIQRWTSTSRDATSSSSCRTTPPQGRAAATSPATSS